MGPKVRGFKPGRGRWILRAIQIRSTTSFGGEEKLSVPCRKILQDVKEPFEVWRKILRKDKFIIPFANFSCFATKCLPVGFPQSSGGRIRSFTL
jgi:hypothetical protein